MAAQSSSDKLTQLLADYSLEEIHTVFDLLQEDHNGTVKPFSEDQVRTIDKTVGMSSQQFTKDTITAVIEQLRKTKSKMSKLGRTQVSRFILSLTRDEIVEVIQLLVPFFVKRSGKFIDTLTIDQKLATFDLLFHEVITNELDNKQNIAQLLLALYSVGRIGESLEILNNTEPEPEPEPVED